MKKKILILSALTLLAVGGIIGCKHSEGKDAKANPSEVVDSIAQQEEIIEPIKKDYLSVYTVETEYGNLICLKPDMSRVSMDMICHEFPDVSNDSIILVFAGPFTGKNFEDGHLNIAGDHVSGGKRYRGYRCTRNTGAFTWSPKSGPRFLYQDYTGALNQAAKDGGMGFGQEMMIHDGKEVKTKRPLSNENVFRALCLDANGELAIYESQEKIKFGDFIEGLLSQGVKEALYTDMGTGWNYSFYRITGEEETPIFLHEIKQPNSSNFIVIKVADK